MKQVHFIRTEDWIRMYIDGVLADEGHSLHVVWTAEKLSKIGPFCVTEEYVEFGRQDYEHGVGPEDDYYARCDAYEREWATP